MMGKPKHWAWSLSFQCHFVHNTSHADCPGVEPMYP